MAVARYLVDKSAWARVTTPGIMLALQSLISRGLIGTCGIIDLELLYSARNGVEHDEFRADRNEFEWFPITNEVVTRAIEVQGLLATQGAHRAVGIADLLIAATAERHELVVLHYDADYELVAKVTGQPMEWIVPRGSVD